MDDSKAETKNAKIIIAEDDNINQHLLFYHLNEFSDNLLFANDGYEAIRLFEQNNNVCLILMDLRMPGMGGVEAAGKIHEINPDVKIIALSAYTEEENGFDLKKAGFSDYLTKPISKTVLVETVKKYLD